MFSTIPQNRLLLYIILIGLLPICFVLFTFISNQNRLEEVSNTITTLQHMAYLREKKQALNMAVRNHYRDSDHFYIDKNIETLTFLEPEVESLNKILNQSNFAEDDYVKKRLELLNHGNSLIFSEGVVQSSPTFQEVIETQVHPVEVNVSDLQKILAKLEGVEIGQYTSAPNRPQLLIIDFKLDKKKISEKNEVFMLNMKLLKREFL